MSITLKKITLPNDGIYGTTLVYTVKSPSGTDEKPTTVESDIELTLNDDGKMIRVALLFDEGTAHTFDDALSLLARWAEDTAKELRRVQPTISIPIKLK